MYEQAENNFNITYVHMRVILANTDDCPWVIDHGTAVFRK